MSGIQEKAYCRFRRWCSALLLVALVACVQTPKAAPAGGIRWGAVGHDDRPNSGPKYSYNLVPLPKQMQLLTSAGLTWYRTGCGDSTCAAIIEASHQAGVSILRGLAIEPDEHADEASNYKRAYDFGFAAAHAYPADIQYYEASNELDNWVGIKGDGSLRSQYNPGKYAQARGLLRGLIAGVHAGNAAAKVLVDDAGWCHYGFLKALWEDGLRWDITAFHWYSDQGNIEKAGCNAANVAAIHATFGLPVWITEFNSSTAAKNSDDAAAAGWLSDFTTQVREVGFKYNIQGVFVYELLDEPNLQGMESHFGIADGTGMPKKPHRAIADILGKR